MNSTNHIPRKPIAIHHTPHSFSDRWIELCEKEKIPYKIINCYDTDIVQQLQECSSLMWHWSHLDPAAANFARQLTLSLEKNNFPVFPNSETAWHFDDKLGQKYLFESLNLPHVPAYAFYSEGEATKFVQDHGLPVVFKLARGAGSQNVQLIRTPSQARQVIRRSFRKGWSAQSSNRLHLLRQSIWEIKRDRNTVSIINTVKRLVRMVWPHPLLRVPRIESGYVYFQEFVPDNDSDVRVIVCGDKAFGLRRMVREGDFRASGSGILKGARTDIPEECIEIAFDSAVRINAQTVAFDFVFQNNTPLIIEISYGFVSEAYINSCEGYWDDQLEWYKEKVDPELFILREFLKTIPS